MGRYGILGGTFNPIHLGHLIIAEQAYTEFSMDKVLVIPSGISYFKENMHVPSGETRLEMCKLAVGDNPHFEVSDIEIKRKGRTYTYETLEELRKIYPEGEFYFICGADVLKQIRIWKNPEKVFTNCKILVSVRDDTDEKMLLDEIRGYENEYSAKIEVMHCPRLDISSSWLRDRIENNMSIKYYLPDSVIKYIADNGLYEKSLIRS